MNVLSSSSRFIWGSCSHVSITASLTTPCFNAERSRSLSTTGPRPLFINTGCLRRLSKKCLSARWYVGHGPSVVNGVWNEMMSHFSAISFKMILFKCPTCNAEKIEVMDVEGTQRCPHCNNKIYPSDCLRIWEEVSDSVSNQSALNRFMNVIEHIFPIHYMRVVKDANPQSYIDILNNVCFFIDGPLAIFGNAAWVHNSIKKFLSELNSEMRDHNKRDIMILGLQKSGYVYDYFQLY